MKINNAEHERNKNRCDKNKRCDKNRCDKNKRCDKNRCDKNKRCDKGCDTVNTWNFDNRKNNRSRHH